MRTSQYALFSLEMAGSQWPMANKNGIFAEFVRPCVSVVKADHHDSPTYAYPRALFTMCLF